MGITEDEDLNDNDEEKIGIIRVLEVMEKNDFSMALQSDGWIGSYFKIDIDQKQREVRINVISEYLNDIFIT